MTIIRVDLAGTALDADAKAQLAQRMIAAFCEVETGHDNAALHPGFVAHVNEVPADSLFLGDAAMASASTVGRAAVITAQVMAGPWTNEMKAELFRRLEAIIRDVAAMPRPSGGSDIWMTIVEVPEGGWGVGGNAVSIGKLAPAFTEDRRERIERHLSS